MRPISIEFQAFGPYVDYQKVDFEKIAANGLFLICGENGAGKTTILDAITFALYGQGSGNGRQSFEDMRCKKLKEGEYQKKEEEPDTFVRFLFENNGIIYKFERRLERKTKNLKLNITVEEKDTETGKWKSLVENPTISNANEQAVRIVGLSCEQFRQVILIPQGKFEAFINAKPEEKEAILSRIFNEDKWEKIADLVYQEASWNRTELTTLQKMVEAELEGENCKTLDELKALIEGKKEELKKLENDPELQAYDNTLKELTEQLTLVKQFQGMHTAEEELKKLEENKDQRAAMEKRLHAAQRARRVKPVIVSVKNANTVWQERVSAEKGLLEQEAERRKDEAELKERIEEHEKAAEEIKKKEELRISFEGKKESYKVIEEVRIKIKGLTAEKRKVEEKEEREKEKHAAVQKEVVEAAALYEQMNEEHTRLFNQYLTSGVFGDLAGKLEEGKACPVCGSTTHPRPAESSEISHVLVDAKKDAADKQYRLYQEMQKKEEEAKSEADRAHEESEKMKIALATEEAKEKSLQKNLAEGIHTRKELEDRIHTLIAECERYAKESETLRNKKEEIDSSLHSLLGQIKTAGEEKKKAGDLKDETEEALKTVLSENGYDDEAAAEADMLEEKEEEKLTSEISKYDTQLEEKRKQISKFRAELEGKKEPDEETTRKQLAAIQEKKSTYDQNSAVLKDAIRRLQGKYNDLSVKMDGLEERIAQAHKDVIFAENLRGDSGIGLQRYVLGIMFSSVIRSANKILAGMYNGRYSLFRSDEVAKGSRLKKKGLEIQAFDAECPGEKRFISSLSGGEKFLIALSLAMGVASAAQETGIRIGALFIDEGFGTLDEKNVNDSMKVLKVVQEAKGIVGIISHVPALQGIPSKLKVIKQEDGGGSYLKYDVG